MWWLTGWSAIMPSVSSEGNVPFSGPRVRFLPDLPAVGGGGGKADGLGHEKRGGVTPSVCTIDIIVRRWVLRVVRVGGRAVVTAWS